jgi:hypothetical protein
MVKDICGVIMGVVVMVLFIDVLGFTAWVASGQQPQDNFYVGAITTNVLRSTLK